MFFKWEGGREGGKERREGGKRKGGRKGRKKGGRKGKENPCNTEYLPSHRSKSERSAIKKNPVK